ncbi:hypothetical protein STW0522RAO56_18170 [Raoultella planticola]|nr:hypothetical protein STW0522RAO56_18170 [Raoultella planticola]
MNDSIKETIANCVILIVGTCIFSIVISLTVKFIKAFIL